MGIKGYATGETNIFTPRYFHQLNAPGIGAWSDYPSEKLISCGAGMLVRCFGITSGTTLAVLLLQLLAGVSFYCCGRLMAHKRIILIAGAILFGLAPYAFFRNLHHLTLTAYWDIPLMVVTLVWIAWPERVIISEKIGIYFACGTAFIAGNFNPYYLGPFVVMLTLLTLGDIINLEWKKIRIFFSVILAAAAGIIVQNIDTFLYAAQNGENHQAVSRDLWWMIKFGLFIPDMIFPRAHQNEFINKISWAIYHGHVPPQIWGESQTAYIGIISVIGLLAMIISGITLITAKKFDKISPFFWLTLGIVLFSVVGGVNYLLGSLGFLLLRSSNRSSIIISCMALYFLCEKLPKSLSRLWSVIIAVTLICVGIYDQIPKYPIWEENVREHTWRDFKSDSNFFAALEKTLPPKAMVFELPVKDFPETGIVHNMGDYEHLRPALHTENLRFSYGTVKGRGDTDWQKAIASQSALEMIQGLESFGFSSILLNRKAYSDNGADLQNKLTSAGAVLIMENADFLIFRIKPSLTPVIPFKKV